MSASTRTLIEQHWHLANTRQWSAFAALLHPALAYEVPQTREYIDSGEGYLAMFSTWPGDWRAVITQLVCEAHKAVCVIDFIDGSETVTGISIFELADGLITRVTDYWPEPYDPPPRATSHMKRRT